MKNEKVKKTGQEWLDTMPIEVQQKWHEKMNKNRSDRFKDYMLEEKETLYKFIYGSFPFDEKDLVYWKLISMGQYSKNTNINHQKKSLWSKIINFFKL